MNDITSWLEKHGLEKYAATFIDNELTVAILPELTEEDLRELGLPMGPRKQILKLVRAGVLSEPEVKPTDAPGHGVTSRDAELRQLTIMFSDLVGSTELSQALDPEDLRVINRAFQDAAKAAVDDHGGYVARYMGDGVLAYFGYPSAGEDDAERAVLAGIELAKKVPGLVESRQLAVRVGIATGPVVVGDLIGEGASQEAAVVGETPNLAARLQGEAGPNQVVVSEATAHLIGGYFELKDLGKRSLKGFAAPQQLWMAVRPNVVESRFEARHGKSFGQFVGRRSELGLLEQRWETTCQGEGQVVLLVGEPGIGKSRLTEELRRHVETGTGLTLRYQCTPYHTNTAFYPFVSQLQRAAGIAANQSAKERLDRLEDVITCEGDDRGNSLGLFAAMLDLPQDRYPALDLTPERRKTNTIRAMCAELESVCARQTTLILFEDSHWVDPTSKEVLDTFIDAADHLPLMMVITHRPEFEAWDGYGHMTQLKLSRLSRKDGVAIIKEVAGGKDLPDVVVDDILAKTDGVPLFVEELAKAVLAGGWLTEEGNAYVLSTPLADISVPSTLRDSLMSRLDRLGQAKEIAQAGACIGREFRYDLLCEIVEVPDEAVTHALDLLESQQLLFHRADLHASSYTFKHALVEDAARSSLLREKRAAIHLKIARALQGPFKEVGADRPELLAHHLTEAGTLPEAIDYWLAAGRRASGQSTYVEAEAHLTKALELISVLPASLTVDRQELAIQTTLGSVMMATRGYGSNEASVAYERARELCQRLEDEEGLFKALLGLRYVRQIAGETVAAREHGLQCLNIARRTRDPMQLAQSHVMLAHTECLLGHFGAAKRHVQLVHDSYQPKHHKAHVQLAGLDPGVFAKTVSSWTHWFLGYPDRSLVVAHEAIDLARELENPQSMEHALSSAAYTALLRREWKDAERWIEEALAIGREKGFRYRVCLNRVVHGWVTSMEGNVDEAVVEINEALNDFREVGGRAFLTYFLGLVAEVSTRARDIEKGFTAVDEGLQLAKGQVEYWWKAELLRLRGELQLIDNCIDTAEQSFQEALTVAREQEAKMWELRAATSLARLWQFQKKDQPAYELLSPILSTVQEGFDTPDIQGASALIETLR